MTPVELRTIVSRSGVNNRHDERQDPTVRASSATVLLAALGLVGVMATQGASQGPGGDEAKIKTGFAIAPVPLDLSGKNPALVGLGSYIVNAQIQP